jgi:hypothetical protein
VLVAGGTNGTGALASGETYDPRSGEWEFTGSLHVTRYAHTATPLKDGTVLVAGGYSSDFSKLDSAELYIPPKR